MTVTIEECCSHTRSLKDLKNSCKYALSKKDKHHGCVNSPIFESELDHQQTSNQKCTVKTIRKESTAATEPSKDRY